MKSNVEKLLAQFEQLGLVQQWKSMGPRLKPLTKAQRDAMNEQFRKVCQTVEAESKCRAASLN